MPLDPRIIGDSHGFDRLMQGIQMGRQNKLADMQARLSEAELSNLPQKNENANRLAKLAEELKLAELNNMRNPGYGSPMAGQDAQGNPVFFQTNKMGGYQTLEGVKPTPSQFSANVDPQFNHPKTGAPSAMRNPWDNIQDPKTRDQAQIRFLEAGEKKLGEEREKVETMLKMADNIDRFIYLNETTQTGPMSGSDVASGVRSAIDPKFSEMKAISDLLTPQMRQGMPGASSDRDVIMFRGATVGVNKPEESNANIARGLKVAAENSRGRLEFMEDFLVSNGHLVGAENKWREYLESNPIFDPKAPKGSYKLNPNRKSYQEHFKKGQLDKSEQDELEALRKELFGGK